ncbi:hypothetical protein M8542_08500 [Amycolatopsis sp. OK19-0408]|uniref:Uncharacterized protein n=1 Tax=Amycolatopsis iheyensis TaxID=2945988 RepID=A0A9X2N944_9PSEU|nr:hypothetical protein [Amycolatopsis iheyensis]MCR6482856.1 hypothetical protein [Amycolatopsis iheyensis]
MNGIPETASPSSDDSGQLTKIGRLVNLDVTCEMRDNAILYHANLLLNAGTTTPTSGQYST